MNKNALQNTLPLLSASAVLACTIYIFNLWLFSLIQEISPIDALFFEGIIFIILGILFLLGSGGITRASQKAALLAATAEAIFDDQVMKPSEVYRRDSWKPKGFIRFGLILIITGIILILVSISTYVIP